MLLLGGTTDKLQVVTGSAGDVDVHIAAIDVDGSGVVTPVSGLNFTATTATTTDVAGAPGSGKTRNVKHINIRNVHASVSNTITVQNNISATLFELFKCTLAPQEVLTFTEGLGWDIFAADGSHKAQSGRMLFKLLSADDAGGTNVATAQPWFPTSGGVSVDANTTYFFEGQLYTTRAAGTTSHTTGVLFGGTATLTNIDYEGGARTGDANSLAGFSMFRATAATSLVVKAASTSATEDTHIKVSGAVRINAAGTFIPQFIYSVAPGGAPTIKRGSFFRMWPVGDGSIVSQGVWQ